MKFVLLLIILLNFLAFSPLARANATVPLLTPQQIVQAFHDPSHYFISLNGKKWFINTKESCGRFFNTTVAPSRIKILRVDKVVGENLLLATFLVDGIEAHTLYFESEKGSHYHVGPDK